MNVSALEVLRRLADESTPAWTDEHEAAFRAELADLDEQIAALASVTGDAP